MSNTVQPKLQAWIEAMVETDKYNSSNEVLSAMKAYLEDPAVQKAFYTKWLNNKLKHANAKDSGKRTIEDIIGSLEQPLRDRITNLFSRSDL